jgi:hypothetical protein
LTFALALIGHLAGPEAATGLQLMVEYDPQAATAFGSPDLAPPELVAAVHQQFDQMAPDLTKFFAVKAG